MEDVDIENGVEKISIDISSPDEKNQPIMKENNK